jgi:hypothetical protein
MLVATATRARALAANTIARYDDKARVAATTSVVRESAMTESAKSGFLDRLRSRYSWLDHVMRANDRYNDCDGNFYAAGITYYTVFALFPVLMVGFAVGGFVLSRRPDLLADIDRRIRASVSPEFGQQLIDLIDSAINSRATVGIIGLTTAAWAGLGWMESLRKALSQMWHQYGKPAGFVHLDDRAATVGVQQRRQCDPGRADRRDRLRGV